MVKIPSGQFFVLAAFFLLHQSFSLPAFSKELVNYIQVPVMYATSREREETKVHDDYGRKRNYSHIDHGVEYGVVTVVIPTAHVMDQQLEQLGCKSSNKKQLKISTIDKLPREDNFVDRLTALERATPTEVCLFVHGYNNSFLDAAGSAARLQLALKEPVILFSWPSQKKTKGYTIDECNAEWSVRSFQLLMQKVEKAVGPKFIMTVSHSMGNRLVNCYLQSRSDKGDGNIERYKEVVLTSPDVDRATFKNYFYKIADNADRVRLYSSSKDIPLRLSKFLHGYPRAGIGKVEEELKWQVPSNLPRTEVVEFTEVDSGWLGHSIQYDLISSMHKTNTPGVGLKAVEDKTYKGDFVRIQRLP